MNECKIELWLTITNVRLRAKSKGSYVDVQVQGDAGEAADCGPRWLPCKESMFPAEPSEEDGNPPASSDPHIKFDPHIKADKLYDKILEALQDNRKVRGGLECVGTGLVIGEVEIKYQ